jgi:hypothetical protein
MSRISDWLRRTFRPSKDDALEDEIERRSQAVSDADMERLVALNEYKRILRGITKLSRRAHDARCRWNIAANGLKKAKEDLKTLRESIQRSSSEPPPPTRNLRVVRDSEPGC